MIAERVTMDPITEDSSLAPLDLVGLDPSWGIYLLDHAYPPPDIETQRAGSADTVGDPVVQSKYGNRTITQRVRLFEPEDPAASNVFPNPSAEFTSPWVSGADYPTTRIPGTPKIPAHRGDFLEKSEYDGAGAVRELCFAPVVFPAAGTYVVSRYVRIPAAWNGGVLTFTSTGSFAGATNEVMLVSADLTKRDQWQRISLQITVVAGDLSGTFSLVTSEPQPTSSATGIIYSDSMQVEPVTPAVSRTNECLNPYAAVNTVGWVAGASNANSTAEPITRYTEWGMKADGTIGAGGTSFRVKGETVAIGSAINYGRTGEGAGAIPTVPGKTITLSAYFKTLDPSVNVGLGFKVRIRWLKASKASAGVSESAYTDDLGADGLRLSVTAVAPAEAAFYALEVMQGAQNTAGDVLDFLFTAVLSEPSATLGTYFPTPPQFTAAEAMWLGVPQESSSVLLATKNAATAYFDGDTPGCDWSGARHASTSTRPAPDGTRFSRIYRDLTAKLDRINRLKRGTIRRGAPGFSPITFDLRSAKITDAPQDIGIGMKRAEIGLSFEADPGGRTPEVQIGATREELTLPSLTFTADEVPGDLAGLGRLVVEDKSGVGQLAAYWGYQHDTYSSSANAALFYEAESRTPLGASGTTGETGASGAGANVVANSALANAYQGVLSTQAKEGGAHLSHVGSYRVIARCFRPSANTGQVSLKLAYAEGDFVNVNENDEVVYGVDDREGIFTLADLGVVNIEQAPAGTTQRWEGRILAKSTVNGDDIFIDCLFLIPTSEASGEVRGSGISGPSGVYKAYDPFEYFGGSALAGKVAPIGGTWGGGGDADDFKSGGPTTMNRPTGVSDLAGVGRYEWLSETKYTAAAVKTLLSAPSGVPEMIGKLFGGVFLRYVDANNWIMAVLTPAAEASGGSKLTWKVAVFKKVAGVKTEIGSVALGNYYVGEPLYGIELTFLTVGTTWAVKVSDTGYAHEATTKELTGSDAVLGTTLKEGRLGLYHENQLATIGENGPMFFTGFEGWEPSLDLAVYASRILELRSDQVRRQDVSGVTYGQAPYEGDYLRVIPAGPEKAPSRITVKLSRDPSADNGIDDLAAKLFVTPLYLEAPPS